MRKNNKDICPVIGIALEAGLRPTTEDVTVVGLGAC